MTDDRNKQPIHKEHRSGEENRNGSNGDKRGGKFYISLIIIYAVAILLIILAVNYNSFASTVEKFAKVLMPVLYGLLIAYLCNSVFRLFFNMLFSKMKPVKLRKILSLIVTYLLVLLLLFGVLFVLVQQTSIHVRNFITNFDANMQGAKDFLIDIVNRLNFIKSESQAKQEITELPTDEAALPANENVNKDAEQPAEDSAKADDQKESTNISEIFDRFINGKGDIRLSLTKEGIIKLINELFADSAAIIKIVFEYALKLAAQYNIWASGVTAIETVSQLFLGFILSVYFLSEKDMLCAKARKLTFALFKPKRAKKFIALAHYSNIKIGHFIKGKLLESAIVGLMAYILFAIFRIPSPLMIAMIVSIMNMIPIFGPFLGAIPAAFIVFIMEPSKTIAYIIIVLIIMQVNGNYISPKMVGNSTGLTPLGAIVALLLMSGYFGVIGMFIGIPICAIIVDILWKNMNRRLMENGLSKNLDDYYSQEALNVILEERNDPKRHRNATAWVVDGTVALFKKIFFRKKK